METQKITKNDRQYLRIGLEQYLQKEQAFYIAKIKASDFLQVYTVRPAKYDLEKHISLANSFQGDDEYYSHLITEDKNNIQEKDFQRDPNNERISKIVKFLADEEYAFFPNTIIANCELINDWENFEIDENSSEDDFFDIPDKPEFISFLRLENGIYFLYVPFKQNSILVIDGQHRLVGLEKSTVEIQENYDLVVAFIIGYDRSIIAKQFYTINYEQKPVNKSLLYQLTGEFTKEINELSFMHNVVKLLNELENSPFQGRIKMLGTTPKNLSPEMKAKLSISQSFLIDSTIRFISAKAKESLYSPILLKYFKNPSEHIFIVRLLARYFNAVKEIKTDWENPKESLISKGMGVGALLKVLNLIFPIIFMNEMNNDWTKIKDLEISHFKRFLAGLEEVNFLSDGPYGKTGSAGSVSRIKDGILNHLDYVGRPQNINDFEDRVKRQFLPNFLSELNRV